MHFHYTSMLQVRNRTEMIDMMKCHWKIFITDISVCITIFTPVHASADQR